MAAIELRDRDEIAAFCRRRPLRHVYELGDLDDFFWPHTRWFAWRGGDEIAQVALLYTEPGVPVLLGLAEEPVETMAALLDAILPALPASVYAHLSPSLLATVERRFAVEQPVPHLKLGLRDAALLDREPEAPVSLLGPADLEEVDRFYGVAYPGTWFAPRMLESGRYVGLRGDRGLVCVAGVHVYSPAWRAAALGNVATLPSHRGRGLARIACAALCRLLLADGIDAIALNVRADNAPALAAYRALGFEPVAEYVEASLVSRSSRRRGSASGPGRP